MKHLIIYYSYTNHTRELVKRLQNKFSYDVFEIEPVIPYSNNYQQVVDEAERDVPRGMQPEIKPFTLDLEQYDVIILARQFGGIRLHLLLILFYINIACRGKLLSHLLQMVVGSAIQSKISNV